jgi:hypothetical protein
MTFREIAKKVRENLAPAEETPEPKPKAKAKPKPKAKPKAK